MRNPDATVKSLRTSCERVLAASEEQERLIDGLLTLARTDQELEHRDRFDLAELTRSVVESRSQEIESCEVRLTTAFSAANMSAVQALIERLVAHLVHNAIEHNVAGGSIEVETSSSGGVPVLAVRNDGRLFAEADVAALAQPLEHRRERRPYEGGHHGLGLAIVRAAAAAHRAELVIAPREAGGLDGEVRFPAMTSALA